MNKKEQLKINNFNKRVTEDYEKTREIFDYIYNMCRDKGIIPCSSLQINVINILSTNLDLNSKMDILDKYKADSKALFPPPTTQTFLFL